ncbi:MAG: hypothetical protein R2825_03135 [Saprospiraceae bacterium]
MEIINHQLSGSEWIFSMEKLLGSSDSLLRVDHFPDIFLGIIGL